jgi:hypothetical protein
MSIVASAIPLAFAPLGAKLIPLLKELGQLNDRGFYKHLVPTGRRTARVVSLN